MPMRMTILMLLMAMAFTGGCKEQPPPTKPSMEHQAVDIPPLQDELATIFRLIEQDQTGSARIRLRNWMQANGEDARALFLFGLAYQREKRYAPAADWYDKATLAQPVYPPTWHFLGWSRYYLGQPRPSEAAFRHHLHLTPGESDSAYGLGLVMLDDGRLLEAEAFFQQSIDQLGGQEDRREDLAKGLFRLAQVQELRDNDVEARRLLEQSVATNDRIEEAWFRLIRVCHRLGDEPAARVAQARHDELATNPPHGATP